MVPEAGHLKLSFDLHIHSHKLTLQHKANQVANTFTPPPPLEDILCQPEFLCHHSADTDSVQMEENAYAPVKFYLQKQMAG